MMHRRRTGSIVYFDAKLGSYQAQRGVRALASGQPHELHQIELPSECTVVRYKGNDWPAERAVPLPN